MDSANWAQLFCTASQDPEKDCGPQMPPPPAKAFPTQGGRCLVANSSSFPCAGGWKDSCPVALGDCSDPTNSWIWKPLSGNLSTLSNDATAGYAGSVLNVDCSNCSPGTLVKVTSNPGYASGISLSHDGHFLIDQCPGMCLSGTSSIARNPPCKGGEFFLENQVILVPCTSPDAGGWSA